MGPQSTFVARARDESRAGLVIGADRDRCQPQLRESRESELTRTDMERRPPFEVHCRWRACRHHRRH